MKKLSTITFILILLLSSCATSEDKIVLQSTPLWLNDDINEFVATDIEYYRVEGSGTSANLAKENAIISLYDNLSKSLELVDKNSFVSSLLSNYYYDSFDIAIEKQHLTKTNENLYKVTFLVSANKTKVEEGKLLKLKNQESILEKLNQLENESNLAYRDNKDYKSVQILIKAYIIARENNYDAMANTYLKTIISRISFLNINIYAKNDVNSLELRIAREQTFMKPLVKNTKIVAQYNGKDINYNNYLINEMLLPLKNNTYIFNFNNKNINSSGIVIFKIDLLEEISLLRHKNFNEAATQIENIIDEMVFSYERDAKYKGKKIIVSTTENDIDQERRESATTSFFINKLSQQDAEVQIDSSLDVLNTIESLKNKADYLFVFKAEIVEKEDGFKPYVLSHGNLEIYDLKTLSLMYNSELVDSIAIKDTLKESEDESFINLAKRVYFNSL